MSEVSDRMSEYVPDDPASSAKLETDWSSVDEVCSKAAWVLEEVEYFRISFDDFKHKSSCNLSPDYQKGKDNIPEIIARGCDQHCIENYLSQRGMRLVKRKPGV